MHALRRVATKQIQGGVHVLIAATYLHLHPRPHEARSAIVAYVHLSAVLFVVEALAALSRRNSAIEIHVIRSRIGGTDIRCDRACYC